jgi:hypothetical protein
MKMNAVHFFETSFTIYQLARRKIAENVNIYQHRCSNLKCHVPKVVKVLLFVFTRQAYINRYTEVNAPHATQPLYKSTVRE